MAIFPTKILLPTDGSEAAELAARTSVEPANKTSSELHVVCVQELPGKFVTGRFLRVGVWLMGAQMIGAMSPLVLFPGELFVGLLHAPTLAAQYIVKDIILVAAAMVIASTWTGARIVAEPKSMKSTLRTRTPRTVAISRSSGEPDVPARARRAEDYRSYAGSGAKGSGGPPRA